MLHRVSAGAGALGTRRDDGFVLLFVLLVVATLSVTATVFAARSHSMISAAQDEAADVVERNQLEAATTRALRSLQFDDDNLGLANSSRTAPVRWSFDGSEILLFAEWEGAKVDVNHADIRQIEATAMAAPFSAATREAIAGAVRRYRSTNMLIPSLVSLLPPCEQLSGGAERLARSMTVVTRLGTPGGIEAAGALGPASSWSEAADQRPSIARSPLVTIVAQTSMLEQRTLIRVLARAPHFEIIESRLVGRNDDDLCGIDR